MAVDERARKVMHDALERTLGAEAAATLMEHLPPIGWGDVATKRDLDALKVATKRDLDALKVATKRDLDAFKRANEAEHRTLKAELRAEIHIVARRQLAGFLTGTALIVGLLNGGLWAALRLT